MKLIVLPICLLYHSLSFGAPPVAQDDSGEDEISWEEAADKIKPCQQTETDQLGWFDRAHLLLSDGVCEQALWFDSFFGDIEQNEAASSLVRLINSVEWHKEEGVEFRPRISASFHLPRFEQDVRLIIEGDDGSSQSSSREYNESSDLRGNDDDRGLAAALRWSIKQLDTSDLDFDAGVRLRSSEIDPFTRLRYRYNYALRYDTVVKFSQQLRLRNSDFWSETTRIDIDHLRGAVGYRWSNSATYGDETDGFEWEISLSRVKQIDERSAYSTYISFTGATDEDKENTERWRLAANYRRSFYRPWYFYEIEPQLNYEREYDWSWNPAIVFSVEIQFGKSRRKPKYRRGPTEEEQPPTDPESRLKLEAAEN
ncbi:MULTISPECIES: hypothetical protein [Corallincola]|uniref:DUF560 domain-containing protein n=3 Tax=Corallincola TaxID=1775176 RepID=A0A368MZ16_9GAMM|nr:MULTISPECIES: hypothetical protein [Corallincola]RCU43246.1 hypothetical protein DU002_18835 [Corallincola holothuriorum]TAA39776.1 hypothetical protein EXY25_18420 [Corallincola spongiicola]TCI01218.1 hypothetical protein EZV61_18790 [Corallincola luteus]